MPQAKPARNGAADGRKTRREYPILPSKPEQPRAWKMAAFDFETDGLHGQVVYGTAQWELEAGGARSDVVECRSEGEMLATMLAANERGMRWYAHNAQYDEYYLLDAALDLQAADKMGEIIPMLRGDRSIFRVTFHPSDGPPLDVFDSMAIASNGGQGLTLAKFAAALSSVGGKHKAPNFRKGETFNPRKRSHREYAKQDTRVLLDCMVNFNDIVFQTYGVNIKGTISATGVKAWMVSLEPGQKYWRLDPTRELAAREAYFGGLSFLTNTRAHRDVVSLDVNSMYPHCMRTFGVPYGQLHTTFKLGDLSQPGLYLCDFDAPMSLNMGCIGYRDQLGMCFPRGKFRGWAFNFEIARALRWGYEVRALEGFCWPGVEYPFSRFVDLCERKRAEHKGRGTEMVFKTMQNSLYGKLGMKPEGTELRLVGKGGATAREMAEAGWELYCEEGKRAITTGRGYLWERPVDRDAVYMLPHWAGWITAHARGILLDAIEAVREIGGEVICGDTDSIKVERKYVEQLQAMGRISIGPAYGQWKIDAEYDAFRAYAPKCYAFRKGGKYNGKAKGIPGGKQTANFHRRAFKGEAPRVRWQSSPNLLAVLKGGAHKMVGRQRIASVLENSDNWHANANGDVRAVRIQRAVRLKA